MSHGQTPSTTSSRSPISAGFIARFFGLEQCSPYANLEQNSSGRQIASQTYSKPVTNPLHLAVGREFEREQLSIVGSTAERVYGPSTEHGIPSDGPSTDGFWDDDYADATVEFVGLIQQVANDDTSSRPTVAWQAKLLGQVGVWPVKGKADLIVLVPGKPSDNYDVKVYILEAKSSVTKRTAHRVQATVYAQLIQQALSGLSVDVALTGAIVNPDQSLTTTNLDDLDTFDFDTMSATLNAALGQEGRLTEAIDGDYEEMPRRLGPRCAACPHEQVCLTHELETDGLGLGLLQLDEGLQETLEDIGITCLSDLADLVDLSGTWRYGEVDEWADIPFANGAVTTIDKIRERTNINNLRQLCVGAARFVDEVDQGNHDYWPAAIQGSGYGLPADDPTHIGDEQYPPDSLIKVFIIVVPDPVRDCVAALAAHVTSSEGEDSVIAYPTRLPRDDMAKQNHEQSLLFRFFKQLGNTIEHLAPDISGETDPNGEPYDTDQGFPHLYFYDERQRQALMDAVRRHETLREASAVRSLLGLRGAIAGRDTTNIPDQQMVSVLSRDLRQRFAMRAIGLGLVQTVAQFHDGNSWFGWDVSPYGQHGSEPSLTEIFASDLFEIEVDYSMSSGSVDVNHTGSPNTLTGDAQNQFGSSYPLANRHPTTLPATYIWAEHDKLTTRWATSPEEEAAIQRYRYRTNDQQERVSQGDIETLLERMAAALAHIERGVETPVKNKTKPWHYEDAGKDAKVPKEPLNIPQLTQIDQGTGSLASTVQEYALLENQASVDGAVHRYRRPLDERVESGRSLLFKATNAWEEGVDGYPDYITNSFLEGETIEPTTVGVGNGSGRTIPQSVEQGDWMVLSEVDLSQSPPRIRPFSDGDRARLVHSTVVKIESLDKEDGTIELQELGDWLGKDDPCVTWHRSPEVLDGTATSAAPLPGPDNVTTYFQAGRVYVLDTFADSLDKMRAFPALATAADAQGSASGNSLYDHIADLYNR